MFEDIFKRRKAVPSKLTEYGFEKDGNLYRYKTEIRNGAFELVIFVSDKKVDTELIEKETGDEYILYKTDAIGSFVGEIREEISDILNDISLKCYEPSVFNQPQTLRIIEKVSDIYGDEIEFLWPKFPDNGVFRRKDTDKWYAAILTAKKSTFGFDSDEKVELIDLRIEPENMEDLLKNNNYYPGWHMNKKSWFTIILDDSVSDDEILGRIAVSHALAIK